MSFGTLKDAAGEQFAIYLTRDLTSCKAERGPSPVLGIRIGGKRWNTGGSQNDHPARVVPAVRIWRPDGGY